MDTMTGMEAWRADDGSWICPTCGDMFGTENGMKVHHARAHGESISGVPAVCSNCNKDIRVARKRVEASDTVFCDPECRGEWVSENLIGEDNPRYERVEVDCANCGEPTEKYPYEIKERDRHFCDSACFGEWSEGRPRPENESHVIIDCDWCGTEFRKGRAKSERTDRHFCDQDCYLSWHSENMVGENSPRWRGGVPDYGPGWTQQKREAVRDRDGRACRICDKREKEHLKERQQKLHVHHITPARMVDDPAERNAEENLISLCATCHQQAEQMAPLLPTQI